MQKKSFGLISIAAFLCTAVPFLTGAARAGSYTYTTIDDPGGVGFTYATGINDSGDIVGYYLDSSAHFHGFLYSGGTFTTIDDPKAAGNTHAEGINGSGDIVGYYVDNGSGDIHGFLYSAKTDAYTTIDDPNGDGYTAAIGINDSGNIVGYYVDSKGNWHGFLYNGTTYTTIDDPNGVGNTYAYGINNSGDIVGYYVDSSSGDDHGFLYSGSTYTTIADPYGPGDTKAYEINDSGDIVGFYIDNNGAGFQGFLYDGGTYTTLDEPNGVGNTYAFGINGGGDIVGYYYDSNDQYHGFLAVPTGGLWQNAVATGGGWYYLSPFGSFNTNSSPWIYHQTLGWLYPIGTSTGSIWFWDPQWDGTGGWWWTTATAFPWVYSATEGSWYYYDAGDSNLSQRWFCNSSSGCALH